LDAEGDQSIGIGLQASFARNSVDFNNISFNSQFNGSGFDLSIPSGESVNNRSVTYIDLNAGILYNYKDEGGNQFSFGAGLFHILKPKLSFFSNANPILAARYTIHGGANLQVGERDDFFMSAHFMEQNGATESVIGGAYGFGLGESDISLYLGTWLRVKDAFYPYKDYERLPINWVSVMILLVQISTKPIGLVAAQSCPLFISSIRKGKRRGYLASFRKDK
jgi:hypothetical protein